MKTALILLSTGLSQITFANGVFNGPDEIGNALSTEIAAEPRAETFFTKEGLCAVELYLDIYRQIFPDYKGPLAYNGLTAYDEERPFRFNPQDNFFIERDGTQYISRFVFVGPDVIAGTPGVPRQLTFAQGGSSFFAGLYPGSNRPTEEVASLTVSEFETSPNTNLRAPFPGFVFDVESRVDGFDELGNVVGERWVISQPQLSDNGLSGTQIPFTNFETGAPTVITYNVDQYYSCLQGSGVIQ